MNTLIKISLPIIAAFASAAPAFAVTPEEMEEARTITAQTYLRYANDGSGYLDEVKAKTLAQLQPQLKAAEKENLKAFLSVAMPKDFAAWDKDALVEYWSVTFFNSPGLSDKGKVGRPRVRRRLQAMTVAAPTPAGAPKASEPAALPDAQTDPSAPTAEEAIQQQEEIIEKNSVADDSQIELPVKKRNDNTWVYITILCVLVGVVAWLVIFASNTMKKQQNGPASSPAPKPAKKASERQSAPAKGSETKSPAATVKITDPAVSAPKPSAALDAGEIEDRLREKYASLLSAKNDELNTAHSRIHILEKKNAAAAEEIQALQARVAELQQALQAATPAQAAAAQKAAPEPLAPAPASTRPAPQRQSTAIFLGRVNANGLFIRADRRLSLGNSVYRLDTNDGVSGTFRVINDPTVNEMVMLDPETMLGGGCTTDPDSVAPEASTVVNESAGTAILENGRWKVLRKAKVRFE